jgi:hypothetical protein
MEFVFTITQGRTGTASLCELFKHHDPAALAVHEYLGVGAHGTVTPDVGQMRRFNTHGLTPEIAAFWTQKLKIHREEAARRGKPRYVETSHMNAMCGLVEYILSAGAAHSEDRFRFIVLNRAPEKIARSIQERKEMHHIESRWLWYLDPKYPRKWVDATPYMKLGYVGLVAWYVREVEARKAAYVSMLGDRYDVLRVDIDQPDWAAIVSRLYGFGVPADNEIPHTNKNKHKPSRRRSALEQKLRDIFAALPAYDELALSADEVSRAVGLPVAPVP